MDGQWSFGGAALDFGLMNQRDPSLSADGLHLVFAGAPLAGADAIYLAERDTLSQPFGPPRVLINTGGARTPFFTSDCQNVYFSSSGSVRRAH
jgi:hypothetical protein